MLSFILFIFLNITLTFNSGANADKVASNTDRPEGEKASRSNANEASPVMKVTFLSLYCREILVTRVRDLSAFSSCIIIKANPSVFLQPKPAAAKEAVMDLLSMDDDNSTSSSPPGSAGGNRHRTASGSSGSAAGLSGDVLAEVRSLFICPCAL